jgi:hypothetical protein
MKNLCSLLLVLFTLAVSGQDDLFLRPLLDRNLPADLKRNSIASCTIKKDGTFRRKLFYDQNGYIQYHKESDEYCIFHVYDDAGRIKQETAFRNDYIKTHIVVEYDETGRMTGFTKYENDGSVLHTYESYFTYDEQSKPVEMECEKDGMLYETTMFTYDHGKLKETVTKDMNDEVTNRKIYEDGLLAKDYEPAWTKLITFTYDKNNRLLEEITTDESTQKMVNKEIYIYNESGLISEIKHETTVFGFKNTVFTYEYEKAVDNVTLHISHAPLPGREFTLKNLELNTPVKNCKTDKDGNASVSLYLYGITFYSLFSAGEPMSIEVPLIMIPGDEITLDMSNNTLNVSGSAETLKLLAQIQSLRNYQAILRKDMIAAKSVEFIAGKIKEDPDFIGHLYFSPLIDLKNNPSVYKTMVDQLYMQYEFNWKVNELYFSYYGYGGNPAFLDYDD